MASQRKTRLRGSQDVNTEAMNLSVSKTLESSNIFKFAIILRFLNAYVCFNVSAFLVKKYIHIFFYSLFAVSLNFWKDLLYSCVLHNRYIFSDILEFKIYY